MRSYGYTRSPPPEPRDFISDYTQHMLVHFTMGAMLQIKNPEVLEVATRYIPVHFPWWIFGTGELIILGSIAMFWRRLKKIQINKTFIQSLRKNQSI